MIIEVFGKQFIHFLLQNDQKSSLMKTINVVSNDAKLNKIFCAYFSNIISELQTLSIFKNISTITDITDPFLVAINMFQVLRI